MGGSSGGGDSQQTIRYAPYIESQHSTFLSLVAWHRNNTINDSPFATYTDVVVEEAFFGVGYTIASFPSLYDMFGKFMAGLDIEVLYDQVFDDTVNSPYVDAVVSAEAALLDDDIETEDIPRLQIGMRDMNAAQSSTYVIGRSIIESAKVKAIAKFDADLRYRLIPVATDRWNTHLNWNQQVVTIYSELMKFYYSARHDVDEDNYSMAAKDRLWPFTVLDFERAALGALQGAMNTKTDVAGASTAKRAISGALSGAAMGAMVGASIGKSAGIWGAGIGAVVGGVAGALN